MDSKVAGGIAAFFLLIAAVVFLVLAWHFGWFVAAANQNEQNKVNHNSQQYQDGLVAQERDRVQGYDVATDPGQKIQIKSTFCTVYLDLTLPPADLAQAHARICG